MIDDFLLDLFRQEVSTNAATLNNGLVLLEQNPRNLSMIEPLMRAAHSIKGAARVIGFDLAVRLAHEMEECLVGAQKGQRTLTSSDIDDLLAGVDWLKRLAEAAGPGLAAWEAEHAGAIETLRSGLAAVARGEPRTESGTPRPEGSQQPKPAEHPIDTMPGPLPPPPAVEPVPAMPVTDSAPLLAPSPQPTIESHERVVRVTAQSLSRLMGLAGESLVEARWLQPFSDSLQRLKTQQARLGDELDELLQHLPADGREESHRSLVGDVHRKLVDCNRLLAERILEFEQHARRSDDLNSRLYREVISSRMRPFRDGVQGFPRLIRDLARQLGKQVRLDIVGETTEVDREILEKLDAPLNHLLRNAVDHGLELPERRLAQGKPETGQLRLEARHVAGTLSITLADDGRGIDLEQIRRKVVDRGLTTAEMASHLSEAELLEFLFLPSFSTAEQVTDISGRGVGLDVVQSMVHAVGGQVRIESRLGQGTRLHLQLPLTLSVIRAVLVQIADEPYAFPHNRIDGLVRIARGDLQSLEERQYFELNGENIGVVLARQVLQLPIEETGREDVCVVLFSNHNQRYGLIVDQFHGEQDLVVRPLDARLGKVPNISAAAILDDGSPVLIADLDDLHRSIEKLLQEGQLRRTGRLTERTTCRKRILVVDDSITVREVERQLLSGRGYEVETAVDGMDGWNVVRQGPFDLVVADVDMPRMNGIELVRRIKAESRLQSMPVVIVSYKDRPEDRRQGLEAGANYYLTKSSFHDETLLEAVHELIGPP